MPTLTPRLMRAMNTAAVNHREHVRKGSGIPYIAHLYAVMHMVSQVTGDEDVLIAALFHDTLEDVPEVYPESRMRSEFGDRVADIVLGMTKDDSLPDWQARADAYLEHLEHHAPEESVLIACADKLHNLMSIFEDHAALGDRLWERFNSGKEQQQWWYREISRVVEKRIPGLPLNRELAGLVERFKGRADG
ncbi:HD domain-containing protein [Corynebacterium comes]|uniref:Bifunctional (P)ppGpp synthase/hydrolase SpoT n=1 Tax=Corynebacterium comes TaxID=2675218 RepID=A0A6B8VWF0_9CORY|nr:HD domain-containing protein [Corynebacterium comes]QGU04441.1 Bifunctional (p)ppGpp synthase/hydrolase SpoT [Corynebacterium comes]